MAKARGKQVRDATGKVVEVRGKASNGAGSVFAYRGGWTATYVDPVTKKRRSVRGRTRAEAEQRRADKLATATGKGRDGALGEDPTIAELADWWLGNVATTQVRAGSLATYRKEVERIADEIGDRAVADFDAEAVRYLLAELRSEGDDGKPRYAYSTVKNTRSTLRQIAETAIELGHLQSNPVTRVPTPKATAAERKTKRVLTADEVHRLLGALDGTRAYDPIIGIMFTSGCRVSEALGLAWSDVNLKAGTARVRRACTHLAGVGAVLDRPKTASTAGIIRLSPTAVALLKARKKQQAEDRLAAGPAWSTITYEGESLEMVFTTKTGALVLRQHVDKALRAACTRAGIDSQGVGTHTGRRSTITGLYVSGVPLDDIARHVGHSNTTTTAGYVQDLGDRPAATARRAWELLDPAAGADT